LLVANDEGLAGDVPLHYTVDDARRFAAVLQELGDFAAKDVIVLENLRAADVQQRLHALTASRAKMDLFVFYYSGHADAQALHMAGSRLPLDVLLETLEQIPANVRVGVLDACQSGAALAAKGVTPGPAFDVRIDDHGSRGQVLISSSAADEQSYESEAYRGALFSMQWVVGLRGAADNNGDAQVTLSEAYAYAYAQTLRSTLMAHGGPQHPTFRWDLSGRRDPVLTRVNAAARLTLKGSAESTFVIFDRDERDVIAEVRLRPGEDQRLALAPGEYVVKSRGADEVRVARIRLQENSHRVLYDHQMKAVPWVRLARKGGFGNRWLHLEAGQYASSFGPLGLPMVGVGFEWELEQWLFGFALSGSYGSQRHRDLETLTTSVGPSGAALYSLYFGPLAMRAGPAAMMLLFIQSPYGRETRYSLTGLAGARVRLDVEIFNTFNLFVGGDAMGLVSRVEPDVDIVGLKLGPAGLFPYGAYQAGLRLAW